MSEGCEVTLRGRQWTHHRGAGGVLHVRGAIHDSRALRSIESLAETLCACHDAAALGRALATLDGFFALVVAHDDGRVIAAADRTRSVPLFWGRKGSGWWLSDDAYAVVGDETGPEVLDPRAVDEFLITSYVTGRRTLHPRVSQLQAGECAAFEAGRAVPDLHRYYRFGVAAQCVSRTVAQLEDELERLTVAAVERMLEVAGERILAIPLSGGRDSRLLALTLARMGHAARVVTFSYGKPGNAESVVSQQVAGALGLRWHFVPYDERAWRAWFASDEMRAFLHMADGLCSVPHIMDWPAVRELTRQGVLPPGRTLVVPGHSADLPAGSRSLYVPDIYQDGCRDLELLVAAVINYHYCLYDWSHRRAELLPGFRQGIVEVVEGLGGLDALDAVARAFESWDWQERQARLIVNAVRVYEFFGHDWWMPWWDREFVDFFARLPIHHKRDKRFYDRFVDRRAEAQGVRVRGNAAVWTARLEQRARQAVRRNPETFRAARWLVRAARRRRWRAIYEDSPMGWYGIVPAEVFARAFTGRESILAFLALHRVGRIQLCDTDPQS